MDDLNEKLDKVDKSLDSLKESIENLRDNHLRHVYMKLTEHDVKLSILMWGGSIILGTVIATAIREFK